MKSAERRERLAAASLYLCVGIRPDLERFLDAVLGAGVEIVQLREKAATAVEILRAAETVRIVTERHRALFIMNDRADLAAAAGADGVHVGQDDLPPGQVRMLCGPHTIVGRSTHAPEELRSAFTEPVDYVGVGPVHATPTKPGRPGVGLDLVALAARECTLPFFVTGGMDARTIPDAAAAGATRFVVVRAITEAPDPAAAVRAIRTAIAEGTETAAANAPA